MFSIRKGLVLLGVALAACGGPRNAARAHSTSLAWKVAVSRLRPGCMSRTTPSFSPVTCRVDVGPPAITS